MNMGQTVSDLLEYELGVRLLQLPFSLNQSEEVAAASVFHHHEQVLARLEHFQQPDHVRVLYLFQQINFLEHFTLAEIVLHIVLLYGLDGHLLSGELVDSQGDLAECSFSYELHEFVEIQCGRRQLVVLLDVLLDVLDQVVALLQDGVVYLWCRLRCCGVVARRLTPVAPLCTRSCCLRVAP